MTMPTYQPAATYSVGVQLCAGCGTSSYSALCPDCTAKLNETRPDKTSRINALLIVALIIMIICAITITITTVITIT